MGHEIIVYRDRSARFKDDELWAIRHFLLVEAEAAEWPELAGFIGGWDWIGPGVFLGLDFDSFLAGDGERERRFLEVVMAAERRIEAFGPAVPLEYIRENIESNPALVRYLNDHPTERWLQAVSLIRGLFP